MQYPDNGAYMVAAYLITAVVLVAYAAFLVVRLRRETGRGRSGEGVRGKE